MTAHSLPVATAQRVLLLGNCQALSLQSALQARSQGCSPAYAARYLASASTYLSHPDAIPEGLQERFSSNEGRALLESRWLENQFLLASSHEPPPQAIILTLFHEATPLYQHKKKKYVLFVSKASRKHPDYEAWLNEHFDRFHPDPLLYLERYALFLDALRLHYPQARFLIVKRVKHLAAYAPIPNSYLEKWEMLEPRFATWVRLQKDVSILEMDRVVGGLMRNTGLTIQKIFPFLRASEKCRPSPWLRFLPYFNLPVSRDMEHPISLFWETMAQYIEEWLQQGEIRYRSEDCTPSWTALIGQYRDSFRLDEKLLQQKNVGAWAGVWERLILHPKSVYWKEIEPYASHFPADKVLFRALRTLLDLHPNRAAVPFLEGHRDALKNAATKSLADATYLNMLQQYIDRQKLAK